MNDYKTYLDKEPSSQQQQTCQNFNKKNLQSSLPKTMLSLQLLWRCQIKKDLKQNSIDKDFLDNEDENNEKYIQNPIIKYSLDTGNVIDYYNQISQTIIHLFFDIAKLHRECITTFHSKWTGLVKTNREKCLIFQDKIICFILKCVLFVLIISFQYKKMAKDERRRDLY